MSDENKEKASELLIEEKEKNNIKNTRLILLTDGETSWRKSEIKTSVVYNNKNYSEITPIYNSAVLEI